MFVCSALLASFSFPQPGLYFLDCKYCKNFSKSLVPPTPWAPTPKTFTHVLHWIICIITPMISALPHSSSFWGLKIALPNTWLDINQIVGTHRCQFSASQNQILENESSIDLTGLVWRGINNSCSGR